MEANLKRRNPSEVTAALLTSSSTSLTYRMDWEEREFLDRQGDLQNKEQLVIMQLKNGCYYSWISTELILHLTPQINNIFFNGVRVYIVTGQLQNYMV